MLESKDYWPSIDFQWSYGFDIRLADSRLGGSECQIRSTSAVDEGIMDELIARIVANVGVDRSLAERAVGVILEFLCKEGPTDKVQALIDRLPGAQEALQAARGEEGAGGGMGGIMGVGSRLMSMGLGMGAIQSITREVIGYTRETAGENAVGEIVAAVPGLSQ